MSHGNAEAQGVLGQGNGVGEVQRVDEALSERRIPDLTGQHLYQPPGDDKARVAARQCRAKRVDLHDVGALTDVAGNAVIAATGVSEHVTVDPACMRKQVLRRDGGRDGGVSDPEPRQDLCYRGPEFEAPLGDQLSEQGGRPNLRDGANLKQRVGSGLHACAAVQDSRRRNGDICAVEDRERRSRHLVATDRLVEQIMQGTGVDGHGS